MARVPLSVVPDVQPLATPPEDYQRVQSTPAEFGGLIGGAEQKFGAESEQASGNLFHIAELQQQRQNQFSTVGAVTDLQTGGDAMIFGNPNDPHAPPGLLTLKGQDALNAGPNVTSSLDELRKNIASGLQNDAQKLAFQEQSQYYMMHRRSIIAQHLDQQHTAWGQATNNAGIASEAMTASNTYNDDAKIKTALDNAGYLAHGNAILQWGGAPTGPTATPEQIKAFNAISAQHLTAAHTAVIEAVVNGALARAGTDPTAGPRAAQILQTYGSLIDPNVRERLARQTEGVADQAQMGANVRHFMANYGAGGGAGAALQGTPAHMDAQTTIRAQQVHDEAVKQGASDDEAWGWAANAVHESGAQSAAQPTSEADGSISHGMFQLNKEQLARYQATHDGHLPEQDDLATQLAYARRQAAPSLVGAAGPDGYASAISSGFEIPAKGRQEAADRAATARLLAGGAGGDGAPTAGVAPAGAPAGAPGGSPGAPALTPASAPASIPTSAPTQAAAPAGTSAHSPQSFTQMQAMLDEAYRESERLYPNKPRLADEFVHEIREQISTSIMLNSKYEAEVAKQKRDNEEAWGIGIMTALRSNPSGFDPGTVWSTTGAGAGIDWEKREEMSRVVTYQLSQLGVQNIAAFGPGYSDVFKGITGDSAAPDHVHSMHDIWVRAGPGGDLTLTGAEVLAKVFVESHKNPDEAGVRTVENGLMEYAKGILWKPVEMAGIKDQEGLNIYNGKFLPALVTGFDKWREKHEDDPYGFLNQANIDKILAPLRRNPTQEANDRAAETGGQVPGQVEKPDAPIPPVPAGLNADAWNSIVGNPPVAQNGLHYTHAAWGEVLQQLVSDPENMVPFFDKKFGSGNYNGAELVARLNKPVTPLPEVPTGPEAEVFGLGVPQRQLEAAQMPAQAAAQAPVAPVAKKPEPPLVPWSEELGRPEEPPRMPMPPGATWTPATRAPEPPLTPWKEGMGEQERDTEPETQRKPLPTKWHQVVQRLIDEKVVPNVPLMAGAGWYETVQKFKNQQEKENNEQPVSKTIEPPLIPWKDEERIPDENTKKSQEPLPDNWQEVLRQFSNEGIIPKMRIPDGISWDDAMRVIKKEQGGTEENKNLPENWDNVLRRLMEEKILPKIDLPNGVDWNAAVRKLKEEKP